MLEGMFAGVGTRWFYVWMVVCGAVLAMGSPQATAVSAQYLCTAPNVTPGSECTSVTISDWEYIGRLGSTQIPGGGESYPSLSALIAAATSRQLANPNVCIFNLTGVQMDVGGGPYGPDAIRYQHGIDTFHQHKAFFYQENGSEDAPCSAKWNRDMWVAQSRQIRCPIGYSLIAETGSPYCARPWGNFDEMKCPASCGKGQIAKGNPVDIATGVKMQIATDYASSSSPLTFRRYYSSRFGSGATTDIDLVQPRFVAGKGWSADYFQRIRYSAVAAMSSATAYRPDMQRVIFNESGGVFVGPADLDYRLSVTRVGGVITGSTLTTPSETTETYDANGALLTIVDRKGITQTLQYDTAGTLASVMDSFGRQLIFTFNADGTIANVTQPDGLSIQYSYTSGKLNSVTDALGHTIQYHYLSSSSTAFLTGMTDENAQRHSTYVYGLSGILSTELAGGANKYGIHYSNNSTRVVTDPLGTARTHTFAVKWGVRRLTTVPTTTGAGGSKALTYDANANVASRKNFNNQLTCYDYDLARNLETTRVEGFAAAIATCPAALASYVPTPGTRERKISTTWHANYRLPTAITEPGRSSSFTHDASGNVLTRMMTDTATSVSRTWTYTYNSLGQVLTEDGPRTDVPDVTTYSYYTCTTGFQCGQLQTITNALGHTTTFNTYNAHGQPTLVTDANGLQTQLQYDARQRMTSRTTDFGSSNPETTTMLYWPTGLLKKVTNPDGSYIEYTYDAAHRLTQINDGALNKIVYTLDAMGNRTAENTFDPGNALRRTHTRVFNTLNQLWKDVNAAGTANVTTTFGYDNNGNQTTVNAPLARNSGSLYDELDRLKQITDPGSGITLFGYDANDNLTSVTDPNTLVTSYTYNGFGDLHTQVSPDTGTTANTYDSGGKLDTSIDSRGVITDYAYDAANRVTSASFTLGGITDQTISYSYDTGTDHKGRLTGASDANHALSWTYDTQGRITGKGQTVGGVTLAMGYGYNAFGQLASTQLPSGQTITFSYNANNQVTGLTLAGSPGATLLNNISYDPFGPITGWTWGNATTASRAFDTDGKITQVDNASGASLKLYGYDDAFRITGITDPLNGTLSWTFGYDGLDRLNAASKSGTSQGWSYDANGNRLSETGTAPSAYSYALSPGSNRIASISGSLPRTYAYDSAGNTLSYATATFTYNNRGRMTSASNGGNSANYVYNALGQRIQRTATAGTTLYVYDEVGHLVGEYTGAGAPVQETVWLGDIPVATLRPDGLGGVDVFYVHADHLNTPRLITDTANNIRWRWESDPFGTNAPDENPASLGVFKYDLRFPGQQFDGVVGLHYNYFRDYDPATGRYAQSDPIGLLGGVNTFAYTGGNPISRADPLGLDFRTDRCKELRRRIFEKSTGILNELRKYDPIKDGRGGFPMAYGSGFTKPGGHFTEIGNLQRGLKNDIAEYKKLCSNRGDWPGCPDFADELANRKVAPAVIPGSEEDPAGLPAPPTGNPQDMTTPTAEFLILLGALAAALAF